MFAVNAADEEFSQSQAANANRLVPVHRVLIVEDDHDDYYIVERLLKRAINSQYELTHVDNFEDAIKALRTTSYDVALLDYFIGERDGSQIVKTLGTSISTPIIMLTGKDISGPEHEALHAGAFDFLDKNEITLVSLTRSIDFALNRFAVETRLRQSEERLRIAREEAEAANHTKSEFLAQMSHELRTPLNAIIGYSEVIMNDVFALGLDDKYKEYADAVHSSGRHLLSLINDLLDLSKIEAGAYKLDLRPLDFDEVIHSVMTLFKPIAQSSDVTIRCNLEPSLGHILADERALTQILVNLISNAVKFSFKGHEVTITARETSDHTVILISDTGIGIYPEEIQIALTPFEQTSGSKHAKTNGTGLGLPITKLLVEQHGGILLLESVIDKGTCVTLRFPKSSAPRASSSDQQQSCVKRFPL